MSHAWSFFGGFVTCLAIVFVWALCVAAGSSER